MVGVKGGGVDGHGIEVGGGGKYLLISVFTTIFILAAKFTSKPRHSEHWFMMISNLHLLAFDVNILFCLFICPSVCLPACPFSFSCLFVCLQKYLEFGASEMNL